MSKQVFTYRERRERRQIRDAVLERDGNVCQYCRVPLVPCIWGQPRHPDTATVDHVLPKSKGGQFTTDNLVACCHECNTARGNGDPWTIPVAHRHVVSA